MTTYLSLLTLRDAAAFLSGLGCGLMVLLAALSLAPHRVQVLLRKEDDSDSF